MNAQELSKEKVLEEIIQLIKKSHSSLGDSAFYEVANINAAALTFGLVSKEKTEVYEEEESLEFDLKSVSDFYVVPPMNSGFTLIVSLKEKLLISKKKIDYKNLFHEEVVTEDLREESDFWFIFSQESDANKLEKALLDLKKLK